MADLDGYCFIRRGDKLTPADIHAEDWLREIKDGKEIVISGRRSRNPKHHRLFFGLLKKFQENAEGWGSVDLEDILDAVKFELGYVRRVRRFDGSFEIRPRSISFASMDQLTFNRFFDRAAFALAHHLGTDPQALIDEVKGEQNDSSKRGGKGR